MKIDRSLGRIYTYIHKSTMFSNDLVISVKLQHATENKRIRGTEERRHLLLMISGLSRLIEPDFLASDVSQKLF